MDLFCKKSSWSNDGSKLDRSQQSLAVVRKTAIVSGFLNRKTADKIRELKLVSFVLINLELEDCLVLNSLLEEENGPEKGSKVCSEI